MNRITKILLISAIVGTLALPVLTFAACGTRPNCADCVDEPTCISKVLCSWTGAACINQTISAISSGDITTTAGYVSGLFTDAKLLILLTIGVPLAFYIIGKALGIMPRR
jgi:hypothetical protein